MAKNSIRVREVSDETLDRLAYIFGSGSAAALAKADMLDRRARGEDAICYVTDRDMLLVGPRMTTETPP